MNTTAFDKTIVDKIKSEGHCPICTILREHEFDTLCQLQYEVTRDEQVRRAISIEGGFCEFHFRQFRRVANSMTNALLLLELVQQYAETGGGLPVACRLCRDLNLLEDGLVRTLARLLGTDEFREVYAAGRGVCIKHMHHVQSLDIPPALKNWIAGKQLEQMKGFVEGLKELATTPYYDTRSEVRSYTALTIEKFVGRKALGL